MEIGAQRWSGVVVLRLGRRCEDSLKVTASTREGTAPTEVALVLLGMRFPAQRKMAGSPSAFESPKENAPFSPMALLGLALLLLAFTLEAHTRRRPWPRRVFVASLVTALGALALWAIFPLFTAPFGNDTPVLRIAYGRENPFGDWNHPFWPYLLNSPSLHLSLEPWAVRIVPFLWIAAELWVLVWLTVRWSGSIVAGTFAGLWMVSELPRRPSIDDLSDWDLAGVFLLGLLAYLSWFWHRRRTIERRGAQPTLGGPTLTAGSSMVGRRELAGLAALMTLGFFSSYMMIVPLGVLIIALWWVPFTRRSLALPATACFVILAIRAAQVFLTGARQIQGPDLTFSLLLRQIGAQFPFGREPAMGLAMAAGVVWLVLIASGRLLHSPCPDGTEATAHEECADGPGIPASLLLLGCLVTIPLATLAAWRFSHVNNGYYVCLATPLWILAGAASLGWAGTRVNERVETLHGEGRIGRWASLGAIFCLGIAWLAIWFLTLRSIPPNLNERRYGLASSAPHISAFDAEQRARPKIILTNAFHLPLYIGLERARLGLEVGGKLLPPGGPSDILARGRWMDNRCQPWEGPKGGRGPAWGWPDLKGPFYVVTEHTGAQPLRCFERLPISCTRLYPKRPWLNFYRCEPRSTAPLKSGPR